jgi:hypothetical protein
MGAAAACMGQASGCVTSSACSSMARRPRPGGPATAKLTNDVVQDDTRRYARARNLGEHDAIPLQSHPCWPPRRRAARTRCSPATPPTPAARRLRGPVRGSDTREPRQPFRCAPSTSGSPGGRPPRRIPECDRGAPTERRRSHPDHELHDFGAEVLKRVHPLLDQCTDAVVATMHAAVGKISRGVPLDLRIEHGQGRLTSTVELLVGALNQFHVLLRHRPLSISFAGVPEFSRAQCDSEPETAPKGRAAYSPQPGGCEGPQLGVA